MLEKRTRRMLQQHNLLDILRKDPNPYGRLKRFRDQSSRALDDLALLAISFPKDSQTQVFTHPAIEKLMDAILYGNPRNKINDNNKDFEGRMAHIAALLVRKGINYCLNQYILKVEQDSALNRATVKELHDAIEICDAIAFKIYFPQFESITKEKNLVYLFNWNKIKEIRINSIESDSDNLNDDTRNLIEYLIDELTKTQGKKLGQLREIKIESKEGTGERKSSFVCYLVTRFGKVFRCRLQTSKDSRSVETTFYDEDYSSPLISRNLVAIKEVGNLYVYEEKKPIIKNPRDKNM
jgi:hypothetical protein